jgi:hypothetical protein
VCGSEDHPGISRHHLLLEVKMVDDYISVREASHMGISRVVVMKAGYQAVLWRDLLN